MLQIGRFHGLLQVTNVGGEIQQFAIVLTSPNGSKMSAYVRVQLDNDTEISYEEDNFSK